MPWRGVKVTTGHQVLQQVEQGGTGVCAGVQVDHVVRAAQLEQGLVLLEGPWRDCKTTLVTDILHLHKQRHRIPSQT